MERTGQCLGGKGVSERQREILEWVKAGKTNVEIAIIIDSSVANVKYHIAQAMDKLDARSRTRLVAEAVRLGIIPLKN